jgi:hypothetical protein
MKLTYKKGGTMGGCYKCGGKMHAAKGMKMGGCYKCGGKMYGQNGMVMDGDPPVIGTPSSIPQGKIPAPPNLYGNYTAVNDNTTNKIQVIPTNNELAYNNAMADRQVITATKSNKSQPKSSSKEQELVMQKILQEEQDKMTGPLSGKPPASGAVNSLGVIGENYLAENPELVAALTRWRFAGPASRTAYGLLGSLAKQVGKRTLASINAYGNTALYSQGVPLVLAGLASMGQSVPYEEKSPIYKDRQKVNMVVPNKPPIDEMSKFLTIGGLSGLLSLSSNPWLRGAGWLGNTYVGGKSIYNFANSGNMYDLAPVLFPTISRSVGKAGVLGAQKVNRLLSGDESGRRFYNAWATPTKKLLGRDVANKKVNFVYDKKTGSFGYKKEGDLWGTGSPLRGFSWSNTLPSLYAFTGGKKYLPNLNPLSEFSKNKLVKDVNIYKKLSSIEKGITRTELDKTASYVNAQLRKRYGNDTDLKFNKLFDSTTGAFKYRPKGPLSQKIAYNFATSPVSNTLKTLALTGAGVGIANTELGLNLGQKTKSLFNYLREGDGITQQQRLEWFRKNKKPYLGPGK